MIPDPGTQDAASNAREPQKSIDDRQGGEFQLFPNRRVSWAGTSNATPNAWTELAATRRASGLPLQDLTISNPTLAGFGDAELPLHLAFASAPSFVYSPDPQGTLAAREAIAAWYADRTPRAPSIRLPPERILLTASSSESYAFLFQALCEPGDEVLAPFPSYPLFEYLAGLSGIRLASFRLWYHEGWEIDFDSLKRTITPRTRAIVVVNPNNPTGSYLKESEKRQLLEICAAYRLALIADEVFEEFPLEAAVDERVSFASSQRQALCISLGGLSKSAGLPQMKLGWMILNGPDAAVNALRERLLLVADTYLSVSTPVQAALPGLLGFGRAVGGAIRSRLEANLSLLKEAATSAPHLDLLPVGGGWSAVLRLPAILSDTQWCAGLIQEAGVLVHPGYLCDFEEEARLVVSLLTNPANFEPGVEQLRAHVERTVRRMVP